MEEIRDLPLKGKEEQALRSQGSAEEALALNEYNLVEKPALKLFEKLGYNYLQGSSLQKEAHHFYLFDILKRKLLELNPWLNASNLKKVVREITVLQAASALEANELFYYKLVNYLSVKQDLGFGKKSQTVKLIDFEEPEKNEFTIVNQFYVKNGNYTIIPDLVVFVNGIPLAILECKSPDLDDPIEAALSQLFGYRKKNEKLFYPNQLLVGLARYRAVYASTFSPAKHFFEWKKPYPLGEKALAEKLGKTPETLPAQTLLLYSLFSKKNLLDLIRNYIVFETEDGSVHKKLCRYNQYIASNKILKRLQTGKGGVVWHTQGSGKSLTMTYTALKLRRIEKLPQTAIENPCLLIVTDRTDLDDQITNTFSNCKFPNPVQVESVEELKKELKNPTGKTLFTTIQKFVTKNGKSFPELSCSKNIIVFADEAHRSQYGSKASIKTDGNLGWATNMRTAIPNALFIGFTGTPIDKKDKSTRKEFGEYIDKYLPKQSIADGATLQIKYQARLPKVHLIGDKLDPSFEAAFAEYEAFEREKIKAKAGRYKTIAENKARIKAICKDIIKHYNTAVLPEGFKAQLVTYSRNAAITYKKLLDELGGPASEVLLSSNPKDEPGSEIRKHYKTKAMQRAIIKKFRQPFGKDNDLALLIVCDMLLTGFDAPIEQVMYLDKPLREHSLMQAVARVNRPYGENKTYGLIIDYCGISKRLREALENFNEGDITGYLEHLLDDVSRAEQAQNKLERFFKSFSSADYETETYVDKCVLEFLSAKDTRIRFEAAFKEFTGFVNNIIPNPEANRFRKALYLYGKIYNSMRTNYGVKTPSVLEAVPKAKTLIHKHLKANGIQVFHEPVSIYSSEFNELVNKKSSPKAKASLIQHKVKTTIKNLLPTNPIYYTSLQEKLEKLILEHEQALISTQAFLTNLEKISSELDVELVAGRYGMKKEEFAFFQLLRAAYIQNEAKKGFSSIYLDSQKEEKISNLSLALFSALKALAVIDWKLRPEQKKKMLQKIRRELYKLDFEIKDADRESRNLLELAKNLL